MNRKKASKARERIRNRPRTKAEEVRPIFKALFGDPPAARKAQAASKNDEAANG